MKLFLTGFLQVFFVACNTYFISKSFYIGVFICGLIISLIWSWNVKKIVFGTFNDRIIYAYSYFKQAILNLKESKTRFNKTKNQLTLF